MKNTWYRIGLGLILLSTVGCLELIRRPEATGSRRPEVDPAPEVQVAAVDEEAPREGNQAPATEVQEERETASTPSPAPAAATAAAAPQEFPRLAPLPLSSSSDRTDSKDIAQINEYALWCIQNGMWKEAKLHLEQALQQDSLVASLHNNLGIVYERFGQDEKAEAAYEQARLLNPDKEAYLTNIQYFNRRLETSSDSSGSARRQDNMDLDLIEDERDRTRSFAHTGD